MDGGEYLEYNGFVVSNYFIVVASVEETGQSAFHNSLRLNCNLRPVHDMESTIRGNMELLRAALRNTNGLLTYKDPVGNIVAKGYVSKVDSPFNLPADAIYTIQPFTIAFELDVVRDPTTGASLVTNLSADTPQYGDYAYPKVLSIGFRKRVSRGDMRSEYRQDSALIVTITGRIDSAGATPAARRTANIAAVNALLAAHAEDDLTFTYEGITGAARIEGDIAFPEGDWGKGGNYTVTLAIPDDSETIGVGIRELRYTLTTEPSVPRKPSNAVLGVDGEVEQDSTGYTGHRKSIRGSIKADTEAHALSMIASLIPSGGTLQNPSWSWSPEEYSGDFSLTKRYNTVLLWTDWLGEEGS